MRKQQSDYWYWEKEISHENCQKIINLGKGKWSQATTLYGRSVDGVRKSNIVWVEDQWVYDLIFPYMLATNERAGWNYNIVAAENCQVTRYTKDGFYTWHRDGLGTHNEVYNEPDNKFLHGNARKLSMSIILNSNFEGGDFEISGLDDENKVPRLEKGSIIMFPSFMDHRVSPVTKGTRYSLVAWFVGPPFV
jgi:PKHD-type hydroxylase